MSLPETLSGFAQTLLAAVDFNIAVPTTPLESNPCGLLPPNFPCGDGGAQGLASYIWQPGGGGVIARALQYIFYALAILMFFYYGLRLIFESDEDSTIAEVKSAYGYGVAGALIVSVSGLLVQAVGPGFASGTLINEGPITTALSTITLYLRLMVSAAVSAVIVFQGLRLIVFQGDEGEVKQQKTRFFHGLIGVAVVTLGNFIVEGFLPSGGSPVLITQIVGISNYLLQILGALCVLAFLAAGFMLVISTDDGLKDRAKKTMFTTTIAIIVVLCCFVIVNFVVLGLT